MQLRPCIIWAIIVICCRLEDGWIQAIFDLGKIMHDEFQADLPAGSSVDNGAPQFVFSAGFPVYFEKAMVCFLDMIGIIR